jgi:hypothetical protein
VVSGQAATAGLDQRGGGPGFGTDGPAPVGPQVLLAQSRLVGQEPLPGLAVDASVQAGDDGRAVLGEHEGVTFL